MRRLVKVKDKCRNCSSPFFRIRGLVHFDNFCCSEACYLLVGKSVPTPPTPRTEVFFKQPSYKEGKKARREQRKLRKQNRKKESFYLTQEWRELRYRVFKAYGRECMCCGATKPLHVDHIKPRVYYPELELVFDNLQVLCEDCNLGKLHKDETDWRPRNPVTGEVLKKGEKSEV